MNEDCQQVLVRFEAAAGKRSPQLDGREMPWFRDDSEAPAGLPGSPRSSGCRSAAADPTSGPCSAEPSRNASSSAGSAVESPLAGCVTDEPRNWAVLQRSANRYRQHGLERAFRTASPGRGRSGPLARPGGASRRFSDRQTAAGPGPRNRTERGAAEPFQRVAYRNNNMDPTTQYGQKSGTTRPTAPSAATATRLPRRAIGPGRIRRTTISSCWAAEAATSGRAASNRLTAYELRTQGKHVWIHGEPDDPKLHDTFFLGAAAVPARA